LGSLAHWDFDGIASCVLADCPRPRTWADYPEAAAKASALPREQLWAFEVYDWNAYKQFRHVTFFDHHDAIARLGLEAPPGTPGIAVYEKGSWRLEAVGDRPAASMVSGLSQLGYHVPDWAARLGDILDNFALAEPGREERIVAGYLASFNKDWWRQEILSANNPKEALDTIAKIAEHFEKLGSQVDWKRIQHLAEKATETPYPIPVLLVENPEDEGPSRLAAIRLEKKHDYILILRNIGKNHYRCTLASLHHDNAATIARKLGGGGRRLWPNGSVGGWTMKGPIEKIVETVLKQLKNTQH